MAEKPGRKLFTPAAAAQFFGTDLIKYDDCCMWIVSQLHQEGAVCPQCAAPVTGERQNKFLRFERISCPSCGKRFTAANGNILSGAKLQPREVYLLAVLTELGVAPARIAGVLRCHVDTVHNWQAHFQADQELAGA